MALRYMTKYSMLHLKQAIASIVFFYEKNLMFSYLWSYDVGSELLKVTLDEAIDLLPFDPLEFILNVRIKVTLRNSKVTLGLDEILPRAKPKINSHLTGSSPFGVTQAPNGRKPCKTPVIEASSSSIYWQSAHPTWNEDFFFEVSQAYAYMHIIIV